jgi:ATP-dependent RNA helicase RhlE
VPILVATDIAARGIDVSGVSHVFNYEIPNVAEQYVHRIGRTARAGADGVAISYVAPDERPYLRDIEKLTKVKLIQQPLPEDFLKQAAGLPAPKKVEPETEQRRDGGRGGRPQGQRGDRRDGPRQDRPRGERPEGDRAKRPFRSRNPNGVGAHAGKVRRTQGG